MGARSESVDVVIEGGGAGGDDLVGNGRGL